MSSDLFEAPPPAPPPAPKRDVYTVTRLNREAKAVLEGNFPRVWVQGEISNLARPGSGHLYFTLKDQNSQVRCAMFKGRNRFLRFQPENGALILANAAVSLYEGRGEFQLLIEHLEPAGEGALQRAFEELKQKLFREGLFDEALKRPLPAFPRCIGIVTSPTGAAVRDILHVLDRRYRPASVIVYPVPVQGGGAASKIARMIETAGKARDCDVLILARGGGSLEDLWAFNDEPLARVIRACPLPIVTGIGHEIDFTIADFAADRRAPTPSAAAELVAPDQAELAMRLHHSGVRIENCARKLVVKLRDCLVQLRKRLPHPARIVQGLMQRTDDLGLRLMHSARRAIAEKRAALLHHGGGLQRHHPRQILRLHADRCAWLSGRLRLGSGLVLERARRQLERAAGSLNIVSPLATLQRGYAIVTDSRGNVVVDARLLKTGEGVTARLHKGSVEATVVRVNPSLEDPNSREPASGRRGRRPSS